MDKNPCCSCKAHTGGPQRVYGQPCTGPMLASLAGAYLAAINDGAVPSIRKVQPSVHLQIS